MKPAAEIETEAAGWLARRDAGTWGPGDEAALDRWMAASTAHRLAYVRLATVWAKADRLCALGASGLSPSEEADQELAGPATRSGRHRGVRWLGGGMGAALAAASAFWLLVGAEEQYVTPIGGFQRVPLADGSRIELNTDSEVEVAYSGSQRRVELERGEAFFNVAKDEDRPFIVAAGDYQVVAVGTAFSVRLDRGEIDVLVTEGRVRIERDKAVRAAARPMLLSAGHKADVGSDAPIVSPVPASDYRLQLGWREGGLIFDNRPLGEVAAEFNRYNRRQLVVLDPEVRKVAISGTFRPTNLAGLTRLLKPGFGVEAVPDGPDTIVLRFAR